MRPQQSTREPRHPGPGVPRTPWSSCLPRSDVLPAPSTACPQHLVIDANRGGYKIPASLAPPAPSPPLYWSSQSRVRDTSRAQWGRSLRVENEGHWLGWAGGDPWSQSKVPFRPPALLVPSLPTCSPCSKCPPIPAWGVCTIPGALQSHCSNASAQVQGPASFLPTSLTLL